jgi:clostripain
VTQTTLFRIRLAAAFCLALAATPPLFAQAPKAERRVAQTTRPWTFLVYGAADNNADGPILEFLGTIRKAIDNDAGIELLLLIDRHEKFSKDAKALGEDFTGARLYRLRKDSAERLSGGTHLPDLTLDKDTEIDSADAGYVQRFIAWGKANYPARHYALLIYSHADGRTMCPDEQSKRHMGIAELTDKATAAESVDVLALELCNMGGIEVAYQWRPRTQRFGADVLIAIPNAGPPLDWDRAFERVRSAGHASPSDQPLLEPAKMTAADFGKLVIEEGYRGRLMHEGGRKSQESAGCYDLRTAADVKQAVDALSVALAAGDNKDSFLALRGKSEQGCAINYTGDGPYVDLFDLCRRAAASDRLPSAVRDAARAAMDAVDRFMIASFGMRAYDGFEAGKSGVFIVLPPNEPGVWKKFAWYTPLAGSGDDYGRWSFLADGATPNNGIVENWFELLDSWFDEPAVGGLNGYRP